MRWISWGAAALAMAGVAWAQVGEDDEPIPTGTAIDAVDTAQGDQVLDGGVDDLDDAIDDLLKEGTVALDPELTAFIDGLMAGYQATHRVPGYVVSVVNTDEVLLNKGYGLADVEEGVKVSPMQTRWHVASISKTFVWTSVMMLVERGQLDLDADVNTYLKTLKMPEGKKPLTLNHIMAHRSGLEDVYDIFSLEVQDLPMAEAMAQTQPRQVYDRGTIRAYSNWATNLAALIISDVTGGSYADFLFSEILKPLGMSGTTLGTAGDAFQELAASKNYSITPWGPEDDGQFDSNVFASLGGMTVTGADMATWMRFHLGRGAVGDVRLLSEETYKLMRQRVYGANSQGADMAHGMSDRVFRGVRVFGHSGSINSVYSDFVIAPELNLGVFIAQNSHTTYDPISQVGYLVLGRQLGLLDLEDKGSLGDVPTGDAAVAAAEELVGRYKSSRMPFTDYEKFFGLMNTVEVAAKDGAVMLGSGRGGAFQPIAVDTWEDPSGYRISAARNENGDLIGIHDTFGASMLLPVTSKNDDRIFMAGAAGTGAFLVTTLLGLWRRLGRGDRVSMLGRLLSVVALLSIVPVAWFAFAMSKMTELGEASFAKIFSEGYPPVAATMVAQSASVTAVTGILMLLTLLPAWNGSSWSIWRKLHHTGLALAFGVFAFSLFQWDLAFNSLTFG